MIDVHLLVEGQLDEVVLKTILSRSYSQAQIKAVFGKNGKNDLKDKILKYFNAARSSNLRFICLVDLDQDGCPAELIDNCLNKQRHPNFLMRVAVREIESWLLADADNISQFLGVSKTLIPTQADDLLNPKAELTRLARKSRYRNIRENIPPEEGSTSRIGKAYNSELSRFVMEKWRVDTAAHNSPSLRRAIRSLDYFFGKTPDSPC